MTGSASRFRVVFDCNTLLQAMADVESPAAACLDLVRNGEVEAIISKQTMSELRRVLDYPQVRAIDDRMTSEHIDEFMRWLWFRATLVRRVPAIFEYPRDPNDEPYINLAMAARAHYLVSRDNDLLSLMTGHSNSCKEFRRRARGLRVVGPEDFLEGVSGANYDR